MCQVIKYRHLFYDNIRSAMLLACNLTRQQYRNKYIKDLKDIYKKFTLDQDIDLFSAVEYCNKCKIIERRIDYLYFKGQGKEKFIAGKSIQMQVQLLPEEVRWAIFPKFRNHDFNKSNHVRKLNFEDICSPVAASSIKGPK